MLTAAILALALLVSGPALADDSVTYHRFGHDVYSDGSRSHEFGGGGKGEAQGGDCDVG